MNELERMLAKVRLLLAEIRSEEGLLQGQREQFRSQLARLPSLPLYRSDLHACLAAMADIEDKLAHAERRLGHLAAVKKRAQEELESLELTKIIEEAKAELAALRARGGAAEEIGRLEHLIAEASQRAAASVASFRPGAGQS